MDSSHRFEKLTALRFGDKSEIGHVGNIGLTGQIHPVSLMCLFKTRVLPKKM